jgi:hypothetical protein
MILVSLRSYMNLLDPVFLTAYQKTPKLSLARRKGTHLKSTRIKLNQDLFPKDGQ